MKILFIDLETTGIDPRKNGVVQIAGVIEIDGKVADEFEFKCGVYPDQILDAKALQVIGKTAQEIAAYPAPGLAYKGLLEVFDKHIDRYNKNDKFMMVGQNPHFDYEFLTEFFRRNGNAFFYAYVQFHLIDLIAITALFRSAGKIDVPNMKLPTMTAYFGIEHKAHDAKEDINATRELYHLYADLIKQIVMPQGSQPLKPQ